MYPYQRTPMGNPYISPISTMQYTVRGTPNCPLKMVVKLVEPNQPIQFSKKVGDLAPWWLDVSPEANKNLIHSWPVNLPPPITYPPQK